MFREKFPTQVELPAIFESAHVPHLLPKCSLTPVVIPSCLFYDGVIIDWNIPIIVRWRIRSWGFKYTAESLTRILLSACVPRISPSADRPWRRMWSGEVMYGQAHHVIPRTIKIRIELSQSWSSKLFLKRGSQMASFNWSLDDNGDL